MKMQECLKKIEDLKNRISSLEEAISIITDRKSDSVVSSISIKPETHSSYEKVIKVCIEKNFILVTLQNELSDKNNRLGELKNIVEMAELALSGLEKKGE